MALARVKNWIAEVLTYSDLNAEFNSILNNANSLISPFTANVAAGGFKLTGLGAATTAGDALRYEQAGIKLSTRQATTSGTAINFTGIPTLTKRITIMFNEVSTSGTSALVVQIGDTDGIETTVYVSTVASLPNAAAIATRNYT